MKRLISNLLILCVGVVYSVSAQNTVNAKIFADKKNSTVSYSMVHPLHQWDAVCKDVSSVIIFNKSTQTVASVAVLLKISTFDSQNANRDSHTIEVLEGIKYPQVTFSSTSVTVDGEKINVSGNLTFHGVTKPISFQAQAHKENTNLQVIGAFDVKMTDYKIEPPSLMGLATEDNIKIKFSVLYPIE